MKQTTVSAYQCTEQIPPTLDNVNTALIGLSFCTVQFSSATFSWTTCYDVPVPVSIYHHQVSIYHHHVSIYDHHVSIYDHHVSIYDHHVSISPPLPVNLAQCTIKSGLLLQCKIYLTLRILDRNSSTQHTFHAHCIPGKTQIKNAQKVNLN